MKTRPRISFGLYMVETKLDATITTPSALQPFSDVGNLKTDNVMIYPYITYEPDYWLLDGSYRFVHTNHALVRVGLMSAEMSDSNGLFATPPELHIDFSRLHNTDGIGLRFSLNTGDYASEIEVSYFQDTWLLFSRLFYPDSVEFSADETIEGFDRIVIRFIATNRPHRYLRVQGIDFGKLITFDADSIQSAEVVEELSMLSSEVRINTLSLTLYSEDEQFSILNPAGYYLALKERQPIAVYTHVNESISFIGQYFLSTWDNVTENVIRLECIDLLGIMDTTPCRGGMYQGETVGTVIEALLGGANIPYELDTQLQDIPLHGWIPAGTLRDALQQIAFAVGAYVDCSRAWSVKIYQARLASDALADSLIRQNHQGIERKIIMNPLVTQTVITSHNFIATQEEHELFKGILSPGRHQVIFTEPAHGISAVSAVIVESGANHCVLDVVTVGEVVVSGKRFIDFPQLHIVDTPGLSTSVKPKVIEVKEAYLVRPAIGDQVAQRVHQYYQQRYTQKFKLFAPQIQLGQVVDFDTLYGRKLRAGIEKMKLNLSGGFIADIEATGVDHVG